jgi:hypothetical protein
MSEQIYGPLITGTVALLFGWLMATGFRKGEMEWPYYGLTMSGRREDQPVRFWIVTILVGLVVMLCVIVTLAQILWPHGL